LNFQIHSAEFARFDPAEGEGLATMLALIWQLKRAHFQNGAYLSTNIRSFLSGKLFIYLFCGVLMVTFQKQQDIQVENVFKMMEILVAETPLIHCEKWLPINIFCL
jgi:hypothetical protein